eukprot:gnl/TRDRNA2_/TRDRNA2_38481_c0_seq1.p1 gnl/TRDRNA2_/TRDRNA2_38481_c0~~gnl/TRDRNA2_/TRDRNA2_38481_c0_seq1.p1  ORF type:complete len:416 (+),score=102.98 gnl/TRDRNA2_/TRDRNA2_38481_c0_seq1:66-1313(+)
MDGMDLHLFNADVDEESWNKVRSQHEQLFEAEFEESQSGVSFFDLRQRTLAGIDQLSAFRIVALGLLRKLRGNLHSTVPYGEVEDALGRYFRLLDSDMQKFATLHETLRDASEKPSGIKDGAAGAGTPLGIMRDGMREIAVVLLACGEMQQRALDLKMGAQRSLASSDGITPPTVSFTCFAEFFDEALAICDQLRRKHEELQQLRISAMASVAEVRQAAAAEKKAAGYPKAGSSAPVAPSPAGAVSAVVVGKPSADGTHAASDSDVSDTSGTLQATVTVPDSSESAQESPTKGPAVEALSSTAPAVDEAASKTAVPTTAAESSDAAAAPVTTVPASAAATAGVSDAVSSTAESVSTAATAGASDAALATASSMGGGASSDAAAPCADTVGAAAAGNEVAPAENGADAALSAHDTT